MFDFENYSLTGMTFTSDPEVNKRIRDALKDVMSNAAQTCLVSGVVVNGVKYGVTTPNLFEACMELADIIHETIHEHIEEAEEEEEEDGDGGSCPICGWPETENEVVTVGVPN